MRTHNKHPQWYNVPLRLTNEEKHNPFIVFSDFFDHYHLNEVREIFWNQLVTVLSSENESHNPIVRSNHIFFYEKIETLIEAAYVIHRKAKKQKVKKLKKTLAYRNGR